MIRGIGGVSTCRSNRLVDGYLVDMKTTVPEGRHSKALKICAAARPCARVSLRTRGISFGFGVLLYSRVSGGHSDCSQLTDVVNSKRCCFHAASCVEEGPGDAPVSSSQ